MLIIALRSAFINLVSQQVQREILVMLKRVWAALQEVLAQYPTSIPAASVVVASWLAQLGFSVSPTTLAVIASAVAVFVGALVRKSVKTVAARKSTSK